MVGEWCRIEEEDIQEVDDWLQEHQPKDSLQLGTRENSSGEEPRWKVKPHPECLRSEHEQKS